MKIEFENIGKVAKAEIEIKSITVIAGNNNSGKSTVGKLLYSLSTSLFMLQNNFLSIEKLESILNEFVGASKWIASDEYDELLSETRRRFSDVERFLARKDDNTVLEGINEIEGNVEKLKKMIEEILENDQNDNKLKLEISLSNIQERINSDIANLGAKTNIFNEVLQTEFSGTLVSKYNSDGNAFIHLVEDNNDEVLLNYFDGKPCSNQNVISARREYTESYYLDDPFLLDNDGIPIIFRNRMGRRYNEIKHRRKLHMKILARREEQNLFDESIQNKKIEKIFSKVLGGTIQKGRDGFVYFEKGMDEAISFEAISAGMKTFSILQLLVKNGVMNNSEFIIFDEPETHLHPEWQLKLAELIIILSINFPVRFLVTSHSPYFIEALELYTKKHCVNDQIKFYKSISSELDSRMMEIIDVTSELDVIYQDLYTPLELLEELRNEFD